MIKRLSEIEGEPIVGRYYLVPCLPNAYGSYVPVQGPEHDDKEIIGVDKLHYHYDPRFAPEWLLEDVCDWSIYARQLIVRREEYLMISITHSEGFEVKEKRRKCLRRMPVFPIVIKTNVAPWMPALEAAYKDKPLNCNRCPHKGMPLSVDNADEKGVVVCPGHGLAWQMKTGKLVSRL
jgi:hypothetical protein